MRRELHAAGPAPKPPCIRCGRPATKRVPMIEESHEVDAATGQPIGRPRRRRIMAPACTSCARAAVNDFVASTRLI